MGLAHRLLLVLASIYHVGAFTLRHVVYKEPSHLVTCAERALHDGPLPPESLIPAPLVQRTDPWVDRKTKPSATDGKALVVADSRKTVEREVASSPPATSKSSALAPFRGSPSNGKSAIATRQGVRKTVDLFVPPSTLAVMVEWAEKLDPTVAMGDSILRPEKEQRLLLLAQVVLRLEQRRVELSEGRAPGSVSMSDLASSFNMGVHDVEMYYKLGLRARSYILMSMHEVVLGMAARYAKQYRMDQQELVQEGYKGVLMAVEKYDPNKASLFPGSTFQGYASFFVMRTMVAAAREELGLGPPVPKTAEERAETGAVRPILLPASARRPVAALPPGPTRREDGQQEKVLEASVLMDDEDGEDEDEEEEQDMRKLLAQRKGVGRMRLRRQKAMRRRVTGGAAEEALAGYGSKEDLFGVDPVAARSPSEIMEEEKRSKLLAEFLTRAAKEMAPQDMQVLSMVFGLNGHKPMKRRQVAEKLGLKATAVSKSKERALRKLREMLNLDK